jgi:CHAD domain-containing protein
VASGTTEREVKLAAWPGFVLPDLDGAVDGFTAEPLPALQLSATYYDTPDLRLTRAGLSLRHRVGDGKDAWTVKLPEGAEGPALVRRELHFPGGPAAVPREAANLVRAHVRSEALAPVARLVTRRQRVELRDAAGVAAVEVADDEVSVLDGRRLAARFREVEVELLGDAPPSLLDLVVERLRSAGAGAPDPVPKVVRALGSQAVSPPDVAVTDIGGGADVADMVKAAIAAGAARLIRHDPGVRLGDDPEDVHQARVATRRLRSDLRTFGRLLDAEWITPLRDELKWLGAAFGGVRDTDVLDERLRRQAAQLPAADAKGVAALLRRLSLGRDEHRAEMLADLEGDRYLRLLDALVAAAAAPRLLPEADAPAKEAAPELVRRPWSHLEKAVEALADDDSDDALHQVRIRAKRCRYAAEAVAPVVGKQATRLATAVAQVQTVLGDWHDAVVAEEWLRAAVQGGNAAKALAAGQLIAVERAEAAELRASWRPSWKKASSKKLREWLH